MSESVIKAQQNIPLIFADAQYVDCFSKEFESFAQFWIPVVLNKMNTEELVSDSYINILSDDKQFLSIAIPVNIKNNLTHFKERNFAASVDIEVQVVLKNDMKDDLSVNVMAAYVDEQPYLFGTKTLYKGKEVVFKLSDVATDNALQNFKTPLLFAIKK